jgi:hypothetical protein
MSWYIARSMLNLCSNSCTALTDDDEDGFGLSSDVINHIVFTTS